MSKRLPPPKATANSPVKLAWWRRWWRTQSAARQDRFFVLGPLLAVLLFLAAVIAAFGYLRLEETDREQQALKRDVEYAQQRLRLRLLERQEQLMRMSRDISNKDIDAEEFSAQAEGLINQYPELLAVTWVDARRRVKVTYLSPSAQAAQVRAVGEQLKSGETDSTGQRLAPAGLLASLARGRQQQQRPYIANIGATGRTRQIWRCRDGRLLD